MEITVIPVHGGGQPGLSVRLDDKEVMFIDGQDRNSLETLANRIKAAMIVVYRETGWYIVRRQLGL